jgi:predicted enzyme related to lactoylglutathione lyase
MTAARFDLVTFDGDTSVLGEFWSEALGLVELEREDTDRWVVLGDADGTRRIGLQRGAARSGSIHLDLVCGLDEFDAEVERLVALGATVERAVRREEYGAIINLADPEGNLFDLCAYVDTHA